MTRAAALREEIKEDVERLDAVALRDRVVAALTASDKAALHHLIRYVPLRGVREPTGIPGEIEAQREMPRLIDQAKSVLRDATLDPVMERARSVLGQAVDIRSSATRREQEREAREAVERMMGNRPGVNIDAALAAMGRGV